MYPGIFSKFYKHVAFQNTEELLLCDNLNRVSPAHPGLFGKFHGVAHGNSKYEEPPLYGNFNTLSPPFSVQKIL